MKDTLEKLAKISEEIFANNKGDIFFATDDGNFFPFESDAIRHGQNIGSAVHQFKRFEETKETKETENNLSKALQKISELTEYSVEELTSMLNGDYVPKESKKVKKT